MQALMGLRVTTLDLLRRLKGVIVREKGEGGEGSEGGRNGSLRVGRGKRYVDASLRN